jgi:hypothetical protein
MQLECSEREARNGWRMRHAGWRAARASYACDKSEATFLVSGTVRYWSDVGRTLGDWSDVRKADGRLERQTDGEDQQKLRWKKAMVTLSSIIGQYLKTRSGPLQPSKGSSNGCIDQV